MTTSLVDPGVADKRLLVQQSEFFGALQAMKRQGNNLSPTMRDAFDKGHLNSMVKNSPAKATDAHITIVGNITKENCCAACSSKRWTTASPIASSGLAPGGQSACLRAGVCGR